MREGPHWQHWPPDDPPEPEHWCERCGAECECPYDPEGDASNLELDKVESATQWFDELSARGNNAGGGDVCSCPASSPAPPYEKFEGRGLEALRMLPKQLDYPAWRLSFSAYGEHMGWEVPA